MGAHQTCQRYPQSTIKFNLSSTQDVEPMESVHLNYQTLTVPSTLCVVPDPSWNFAACFNALDCAMTSGMSNEVGSQDDDVSDEIALFINQMIPHHQNAVNMCKTLIKQHLKCAKLTPESAEKDIGCTMSLLCS